MAFIVCIGYSYYHLLTVYYTYWLYCTYHCLLLQLNRLVMWHLPALHTHFTACDVSANLYATSWLITLLAGERNCYNLKEHAVLIVYMQALIVRQLHE
jgi:Rab-GTPase-TBC domain